MDRRALSAACALVVLSAAPASARDDYFKIDPAQTGGIQVKWVNTAPNRGSGTYDMCVSFVNNGPKPASAIRFVFRYLDGEGKTLGTTVFDRKGSFGHGVLIEGHGGTINARLSANCIEMKPPGRFETIGVSVERVDYEDGTFVLAPGAERATGPGAGPSPSSPPNR